LLKIAPSLLSADFSHLNEEVKRVEDGGADLLHFDVMDGCFVPNITFGSLVVQSLRDKTTLPFDVHLMIEKPDNYIERFAEAGGDIITVHAEACIHLQRTLKHIKQHGVKAGVALNPETPIHVIEDVLDNLDMILVMTVNPGYGGQDFIATMLPKIRKAKSMIEEQGLIIDIEVDGGINIKTAPLAVNAGANILVAGTAIFSQPDVKQVIQMLRKSERIAVK
jgi:ribulose-phosphate 3-epimerase